MTIKKFLTSALKIMIAISFWLIIWILVSSHVNIEFLFPSPHAVWKELLRLVQEKSFWLIAITSLLRVVWGILVSWVLGALLAFLTSTSRLLNAILSPAIIAVKSTPVASFIILAMLWIDRGVLPVFITELIVTPIVWANVSEGIKSVEKNLIDVADIYGFSIGKKMFRVYVPSIAPYFMAACKSSLGMAWKAGISAEVLSTPEKAIGTELYFAKTYLETPTLFAWTAVVIILSVII